MWEEEGASVLLPGLHVLGVCTRVEVSRVMGLRTKNILGILVVTPVKTSFAPIGFPAKTCLFSPLCDVMPSLLFTGEARLGWFM